MKIPLILDDKLFQSPLADELESKRYMARGYARSGKKLVYDCLNASLYFGTVTCRLHTLSQKGGKMGSLACLRGVSSKACQGCPDYRTEII